MRHQIERRGLEAEFRMSGMANLLIGQFLHGDSYAVRGCLG
jgi:hypothetical protein